MLPWNRSLEEGLKAQRKSRRERFVQVAGRRTRQVLRDLRLLGNCGNRSGYEYGDRDVDKIFSAIERDLALARSRFKTEKREIDFTLE